MGSEQRVRCWLAVIICYSIVLFIGGVYPFKAHFGPSYTGYIIHFFEYLILAWMWVHAVRSFHLTEREYLFLSWIYATTYGLFIELVQTLLPWRSADFADAIANSLGAAVGVWIGYAISQRV